MKRTFAFLSIFAVAITGVMVTPQDSSAVPAFARQTGYECNACHFQYFPKLSAMGRAFKLGGYRETSVDLIEGDNISMPAIMPVSFITKFKYVMKTNKEPHSPKAGAERGEWELPDEATFFIGGRVSENVGWANEVADTGWGKGSVLFNIPTGSDLTVGVYVQVTDGHGPANGLELNNTGFQRGQRGWEDRASVFAAQKTLGTAATGLGLYGGNDMFWFNVGFWGPMYGKFGGEVVDTGFDFPIYYRAAFTPSVAGFDLSLGVIGSSGTGKCVECMEDHSVVHEIKIDFTGADFQAQGEVAGMQLEVNGSYLTGGGDGVAFPGSTKKTAMNVGAYLSLTPALVVKANMKNEEVDGGDKWNATSVGLNWLLAQNVHLSPEYTIFGGDSKTDSALVLCLFIGY
ncbi:MAG: hypothetical protein OEZ04_13980 [Nitrospinota bacterium]|nr:hypothetical protein [Nitrospinota bacterium]